MAELSRTPDGRSTAAPPCLLVEMFLGEPEAELTARLTAAELCLEIALAALEPPEEPVAIL